MKMLSWQACGVLAAVGLMAPSARGEGSAQVGTDQRPQAAEDREIGTTTLHLGTLGVDILNYATETIAWTGTGTIDIYAPGLDPTTASPTDTISSGESFAPNEKR